MNSGRLRFLERQSALLKLNPKPNNWPPIGARGLTPSRVVARKQRPGCPPGLLGCSTFNDEFSVVRRHLSFERLIAERARVSHDISNIANGIDDMLAMVAARQITSDHADCVVAQCREEHRMLGDRLELLDAAIAECGKF